MGRPVAFKQGITNTRNQPKRNLPFADPHKWNVIRLDSGYPPPVGTLTAANYPAGTAGAPNGWTIYGAGTGAAVFRHGNGAVPGTIDWTQDGGSADWYYELATGTTSGDSAVLGYRDGTHTSNLGSLWQPRAGKKAMMGMRFCVLNLGAGAAPQIYFGWGAVGGGALNFGAQATGFNFQSAGSTLNLDFKQNSAHAAVTTFPQSVGAFSPAATIEAYFDGANAHIYKNRVRIVSFAETHPLTLQSPFVGIKSAAAGSVSLIFNYAYFAWER